MKKYTRTIYAGYYKCPLTGKRKQRKKQVTLEAANQKEANLKFAKAEELYRQQYASNTNIRTFSQLVDEYYRIKGPDLKAKTISGDRYFINRLKLYFGEMNLTDITSDVIENYLINLSKLIFNKNTLHGYRKNLHKYMEFAFKKKYISVNPFIHIVTKVGIQSPPKKNHKYIMKSHELIFRLLFGIGHLKCKTTALLQFKLQYLLVTDGNLRRAELYGLRWGDVDFENKEIKIQRNAYTITKKESILQNVEAKGASSLKTDGSYRHIPISDLTIKYLKSYQKVRNKYLEKRKLANPEQLLFFARSSKSATGESKVKPAYGNGFASMLIKIATNNNIEKITPHDIRRVGNSLRMRLGFDQELREYLMGHIPDKVTQAYLLGMEEKALAAHPIWNKYINDLSNKSALISDVVSDQDKVV